MQFQKKAPNGTMISGVVLDDPAKFPLYKLLSLDVFEKERTKENQANVSEVVPASGKKKGKNAAS